MHDFATQLRITDLFGYLDHTVDFATDESQITILTGANGSGKTRFLNILRSMVGFNFVALSKLPFSTATLTYVSTKVLTYEYLEAEVVKFTGYAPGHELGELLLRILPDPLIDVVPEYFERIDDDLWVDRTDGELVPTEVLRARFGHRGASRQEYEVFEEPATSLDVWRSVFRVQEAPTLVETKRLDTRFATRPGRRSVGPSRAAAGSRIRQYVNQVADQIASARRASLEASQRADRQFAARALDKARTTVKELELRRSYQALAELNQELNTNGLTEATAGVEFPGGRTNPTERRIISVFLEDWESKLTPLVDVHKKLQILRAIVGDKLQGKALTIDGGQLAFRNLATGVSLDVDRLSSGEQHLLALFTMLIFNASPGTLVLIDEPEISLHAAWKHAFLKDIGRVARLNDLQVVLATHSSGIVNGEWDLTRELVVDQEAG